MSKLIIMFLIYIVKIKKFKYRNVVDCGSAKYIYLNYYWPNCDKAHNVQCDYAYSVMRRPICTHFTTKGDKNHICPYRFVL